MSMKSAVTGRQSAATRRPRTFTECRQLSVAAFRYPILMNTRVKKIILLSLAVALLVGSGQVQKSLNRDRQAAGSDARDAVEKRAAAAGVHHRGAGRVPRIDFQLPLDSRE